VPIYQRFLEAIEHVWIAPITRPPLPPGRGATSKDFALKRAADQPRSNRRLEGHQSGPSNGPAPGWLEPPTVELEPPTVERLDLLALARTQHER
jgi:hypothetical protein